MSPGFSVGKDENIIPNVAKQNAGKAKPKINPRRLNICVPNHASPISSGTIAMAKLKRKPPRVLPSIIE
jgi:hypothetical protein